MGDLFGGGGEEVRYEPKEVEEDEKKLKRQRTALYKTKGGALGEELQLDETSERDTFFGN